MLPDEGIELEPWERFPGDADGYKLFVLGFNTCMLCESPAQKLCDKCECCPNCCGGCR
jgi:hypothetical protein